MSETSIVALPPSIRGPFEVYVNGVRQELGADYARVRSGEALRPGAAREDAWHRAVEFLFERLAVSWSIAGAPPITRQRELLARLRVASPDERAWVRERLREHCGRCFPDVSAP